MELQAKSLEGVECTTNTGEGRRGGREGSVRTGNGNGQLCINLVRSGICCEAGILNGSSRFLKEGAMVRSLSKAITGSYILGVIGKECWCPG